MLSYLEYCALAQKLHHAAIAYFHHDAPIMSDSEYDALYRELIAWEALNPDQIVLYSPSQRVGSLGAEDNTFEKVAHKNFMGSLDNVFTRAEYEHWWNNSQDVIGHKAVAVIAELKVDGLAVSLHYKNGHLEEAITRGDGLVGERVLKQIQTIRTIPLVLQDSQFTGEIRGEVYFKTKDFLHMNQQQEAKGQKTFANPRNAAAGSLRQLDWTICAQRPLSFIPYTILGLSNALDQQTALLWAHQQGFEVSAWTKEISSIQEAEDFVQNILNQRSHLPFGIDGIVFKIARFDAQLAIGATSRAPRWAVAWKLPADRKVTKLLAVDYQVGRLGTITPVAVLQPVSIDGVTVQSATLHNMTEIARKNIHLQQDVWIQRAGDVIPEVLGPVNPLQSGIEPITPPATCVSCHTPLVQETEDRLICPAQWDCPEQKIQRLTYAFSQDALNVPGLSSQSIKKAVEAYSLHTPSQLFGLSQEQWESLDGIGPKLAQTFLKNLKKSLMTTPDRFLLAFSIPHVGKTTATSIFSSLSWEIFLKASLADLQDLPNIGPITALALCSFKESAFFQSEYTHFLQYGLQWISPEVSRKSNRLQGLFIVVTGSFSQFSREQWQQWVISHGGQWETSVTKKTHCLIAGQAAGSKKQKAQQQQIPIVEDDRVQYFIECIEAGDKESEQCLRNLHIRID